MHVFSFFFNHHRDEVVWPNISAMSISTTQILLYCTVSPIFSQILYCIFYTFTSLLLQHTSKHTSSLQQTLWCNIYNVPILLVAKFQINLKAYIFNYLMAYFVLYRNNSYVVYGMSYVDISGLCYIYAYFLQVWVTRWWEAICLAW